jgi:glycine/D-amino acid oxidase-like deaminating enzyme
VAVRTHVLATRPLTAAERDALGWDGTDAVIDQRTFFSYYRMDVDGRLLFGGGPVCRPEAGAAASERVWQRLRVELARLFPALHAVPIEHRWSGLTGATMDRIPVVGEVPRRPGVIFAGAWSGHGLAMSVAGGASLADRLAERAPVASYPWHRSSTRNPRLGPLQPAFVKSYVAALDAVDRMGAALERVRRTPTPTPTPGRAKARAS